MSTEPRIVEQWLSYRDDLPVKLGEVFTPEPWKHDLQEGFWGEEGTMNLTFRCRKCEVFAEDMKQGEDSEACSVPDPITIDLSTAIGWFRAMPKTEYTIKVMHKIYRLETGMRATLDRTLFEWFLFAASPEALLIAAAMAMDRSKE